MTKNNIKTALFIITIAAPCLLFGEGTAAPSAKVESLLDINIILAAVTLVLLLPLYLSAKTFVMVACNYAAKKMKENATVNKISAFVIFFMLAQNTFAQATETVRKPQAEDLFSSATITWILIVVIGLLLLLIVAFSFLTTRLIKPVKDTVPMVSICPDAVKEKGFFASLWDRINSFKPLTEEAKIDTGHSYDGIRELNNITPPWFTAGFIISIIVAAGYLYVYHVAKSAPLQIEEYNIEMAEAAKEKAKMLAIQGNNVDENSVVMLGASDIEMGKKLFTEKCVACHAATGGSMPGGVGPNLTDAYWLHGGSIKDIFKTIKYGWVEKGMISWKDQMSARQIAQVASFIYSIKGSNPAGAKEPQGELYKEVTEAMAKDSLTSDSVLIKK